MTKEVMKQTLEKIANVNAMDYEYQRWAREALEEALKQDQFSHLNNKVLLQYPKEDVEWQKQQMEYAQQLKVNPINKEQDKPVAEFKSPSQRWEDGNDHDPRSEELYKFIADTDFEHCGDSFCFKSGGDGDNGETLMFILDCWFDSTPQTKEWVGLTDAVRYQWLRNEFAHGRETYLAEGIPSGEYLDKYIDEQLIKKEKNT